MKSRPIIMDGQAVRAILTGAKTQTRRPCKAQQMAGFEPWFGCADGYQFWIAQTCPPELKAQAPDRTDHQGHLVTKCTYGQVGDQLWVRETWLPTLAGDAVAYYRASMPAIADAAGIGWRSSIQMPRWASRITLAITAIRVQRLQDITAADICAELGAPVGWPGPGPEPYLRDLTTAFHWRWDTIYGTHPDYAWAANPWVWAITFSKDTTHASPAA